MLYTNADQLLCKRDDLCLLICNEEPDLILVTEVIPKAQRNPIAPAQLSIPGYNVFTSFNPSFPNLGPSGTRGICIYAADHLRVSEVSLGYSSVEHIWIRLSLVGSDGLLLGCIYRSPSSGMEESILDLDNLFQQATSMSFSHVLIAGDFNIPHIDWENQTSSAPATHASHTFIETVQDCLLYQHIKDPTRYRLGETPNTLDLVFTNEEGMVKNIQYLSPLGNSDHVVLRFALTCYMNPVESFPSKRVITDYKQVSEVLRASSWSQMEMMSLDDAYSFFRSTVTLAIEKSSKTRSTHRNKNIYMDRKAMQMKKKKQTLWGIHHRTHDPIDFARFARCRNELRRLTRNLRSRYESKLVSNLKQNPKAFWRYASSRLRTRSRVDDLRTEDGAITSSNQEKADVLSRYFTSVFTQEGNTPVPMMRRYWEGPTLEDVDVSPIKVEAKLALLRPNSSPGPDTIHPRILCESAQSLAIPLSILFRKSLDSGRLPHEWKTGEITPIFKKGDRQSPSSYRPVSLTAVPSKVLESLVRDNLLHHMSATGMLHGAQHGFLPKRSCATQLMEVVEDWTAAMEDGDPVDVVYLDFAKAFDSVPHQRLIHKLHAYGIRGKLLNWITAFLLDRQQRVVVQGSRSAWAPVTSGVPQGSVLGPVLFTIFVNDMPWEVSSSIKLFADDTKLYRRVPRGDDDLQADIDALVRWSTKWLLPFNASKCTVMHIGHQNPSTNYSLGGTLMEVTTEEKDLGIIVDTHMNFHKQTAVAISKASQMLAVIKCSFANINEFTLPLLFKTMVRPLLEYCNTVWGPFGKVDQQRLERVQRRATRMVLSIRHLPYPERLRLLRLPSLCYRRRRGDMVTVYQLLHGGMAVPQETFLVRNTSKMTRGHPWKLRKPRTVKLPRRNAFSSRVINDWNALPAEVVSAESVNQFKNRLDRHWRDAMYDIPFP